MSGFNLSDPICLRSDVRKLHKQHFEKYLKENMIVYDIGCGNKPFANFLEKKTKAYIGVDIEDGFYDSSYIDIVGSAYNVPIEPDSADAVILAQVLEHLEDPFKALEEMKRIIKQDGLLFLSCPFMYPIHSAPHDYVRYTPFFLKKALQNYGFAVLQMDTLGGFWYTSGVMNSIYLQNFDRGFLKKTRLIRLVIYVTKFLFRAMHEFEQWAIKKVGKSEAASASWAANHVLVAVKKSFGDTK